MQIFQDSMRKAKHGIYLQETDAPESLVFFYQRQNRHNTTKDKTKATKQGIYLVLVLRATSWILLGPKTCVDIAKPFGL